MQWGMRVHSYAMSGVAAWSIITGASFFDVLEAVVAAHPDKLELYLNVAGRKWLPVEAVRVQLTNGVDALRISGAKTRRLGQRRGCLHKLHIQHIGIPTTIGPQTKLLMGPDLIGPYGSPNQMTLVPGVLWTDSLGFFYFLTPRSYDSTWTKYWEL